MKRLNGYLKITIICGVLFPLVGVIFFITLFSLYGLVGENLTDSVATARLNTLSTRLHIVMAMGAVVVLVGIISLILGLVKSSKSTPKQ